MKSSGLISELIELADLTAEIKRTAEVVRRKRRSDSGTAPGTAQYINIVRDSLLPHLRGPDTSQDQSFQ